MELFATKGNVVVLPDAKSDKTKSGLFIPDTGTSWNFQSTGTVVSVHDSEKTLKIGDKVIFKTPNITKIFDYYVLPKRDVLATLEDDEKKEE